MPLARERNPFKPTAGATPPLLVGRRALLDELEDDLQDGPGAPGRLTIFTGPRGVGKTVMLSEVGDLAGAQGWVVLAETATPGLLERLTHTAARHTRELDHDGRGGRTVAGLTLPVIGGGLTLTPPATQPALGWREQAGLLLDAVEPHDGGLLVTIDEVHKRGHGELRDLAATFQHLVREDREVALVMAGLPSAISDLLNDEVLTFLRRATTYTLRDVALTDVRDALASTITTSGRTITPDALDLATTATGGYPFMIQLVGYHVWRSTTDTAIDLPAATTGVAAARRRLGTTVHATALADLSDVDRTYLVTMAADDGPSSTSGVARRMGESVDYTNVYRRRLIDAGIIEPAGRGLVTFTLPYLREYLREHTEQYAPRAREHR